MSNLVRIFLIASAIAFVVPANAHHSFAATFTEEIIVVEGVVERVKFSNPHVIVYFTVTDETGQEATWLAEGGATNAMALAIGVLRISASHCRTGNNAGFETFFSFLLLGRRSIRFLWIIVTNTAPP